MVPFAPVTLSLYAFFSIASYGVAGSIARVTSNNRVTDVVWQYRLKVVYVHCLEEMGFVVDLFHLMLFQHGGSSIAD